MTETSRNSAATTEEAFHKHYAAIWGTQRWQNILYPALASQTRQCALLNQYVSGQHFHESESSEKEFEQLSFPSPLEAGQIQCLVRKAGQAAEIETSPAGEISSALPTPQPATSSGMQQRLMTHWNFDAASALAVQMLDVQPYEDVLDLCAAPGGKSVGLAQRIWPHLHSHNSSGPQHSQRQRQGRLTVNELDGTRHKRLTENLKSYLPVELFNSKSITIHGLDCTDSLAYRKFSTGGPGYDKVLVDAPCSSERHIIHAHLAAQAGGRVAPEMANWRPGSSKRLAKTQAELLMTGLRAARFEGTVLYATCSIESAENDGVVEKVLATVEKEVKKGGKWSIKVGFNRGAGDPDLESTLEQEWAERTKYGWIVLPDHPNGGRWGPLFFVILTKVRAFD